MPNRIIKETIRTNRSVNDLTDFQFRLWTYLITYVDDYGRGSADPELLKGFLFPRRSGVTEKSIKDALTALELIGLVNLYTVDGEPYLYFPSWSKHQRIQTKRPKFPEPTNSSDSTVGHRESPWVTVGHRESPPESNPNPNPNPNPKKESMLIGQKPAERSLDELFDEFWDEYPRKVGKPKAKSAYERFLRDGIKPEVILSGLRKINELRWSKFPDSEKQFIPHPSTWLNQRRWEDNVEPYRPPRTPNANKKPELGLSSWISEERKAEYAKLAEQSKDAQVEDVTKWDGTGDLPF